MRKRRAGTTPMGRALLYALVAQAVIIGVPNAAELLGLAHFDLWAVVGGSVALWIVLLFILRSQAKSNRS